MPLLKSKDESWRQECGAADFKPDFSSRHFVILHLLDDYLNTKEQDFWAELAQIQADFIHAEQSAY
jgi:hypothetical protein